ncbi:MAG: Uma2 family endonuclease [Bacteroidota bacterium]
MDKLIKDIPQALIYEMVDGKPIYYRDYQEYLSGDKEIEEIMGSSYLQSLIITELVILLSKLLDSEQLRILANEIGIQFSKKSWRSADIAIYEKAKISQIAPTNKYLKIPPKIVFEVDTKAHLKDLDNPFGYFQEKTGQLLNFGVEKVIWIFTETQKVMLAEKNKDWVISDWMKSFQLEEHIEINISQLIGEA